jgi:hypothetical protein
MCAWHPAGAYSNCGSGNAATVFFLCSGTIDSGELKSAMESLGYKKKNKMAYQMIENMKKGEITFDECVWSACSLLRRLTVGFILAGSWT